jgi:hypothetical protein
VADDVYGSARIRIELADSGIPAEARALGERIASAINGQINGIGRSSERQLRAVRVQVQISPDLARFGGSPGCRAWAGSTSPYCRHPGPGRSPAVLHGAFLTLPINGYPRGTAPMSRRRTRQRAGRPDLTPRRPAMTTAMRHLDDFAGLLTRLSPHMSRTAALCHVPLPGEPLPSMKRPAYRLDRLGNRSPGFCVTCLRVVGW